MPPAMGPLTEMDPDLEHEGAATKRLKAVLEQRRSEKKKLAMDALAPDAYICVKRPFWDFKEEHKHEDYLDEDEIEHQHESESDDEDEGDEDMDEDVQMSNYEDGQRRTMWTAYVDEQKSSMGEWPTQAEERPERKWIMMKDAWSRLDLLERKSSYCEPGNFRSIYFYSRYQSYGLNEILEGQMLDLHDAYAMRDVNQMWCIASAVAHWLNGETTFGSSIISILVRTDDCDGICDRIRVAGCMFLTVLDAIDHVGELKQGTRFRDFGLVCSLWLEWSWALEGYGIGDDGECAWRKNIVAYAKKAHVNLAKTGVVGGDCSFALKRYKNVKSQKRDGKGFGRWHWACNFLALAGDGQGFGRDFYDVTRLSREERAEMADDGKDPLSDIPEAHLQKNMLWFR
ncbi:hypothetical protein LTS10_003303 [Elasticomyces elasticus]|nr:hypothetical protein LTS10_003303 [Elasticomyces elasticus]